MVGTREPGAGPSPLIDRLRAFSAFVIGFLSPISVTYSEIAVGLSILVLMAERRPPAQGWQEVRSNPVSVMSLLLFAMLGLATLYSTVPIHQAFLAWIKYRELIYLPILILLCREERTRQAGLLGFCLALLVIMAVALTPLYPPLADYFYIHLTGVHPADSSFGSHVTEGMLVSLGAYFASIEAIRRPDHRLAAAGFVLLALLYMLLHNTGRTGYLVLVVAAIMLVIQVVPRRLWVGGTSAILLAAVAIVLLSPGLQQRLLTIGRGLETGLESSGGNVGRTEIQPTVEDPTASEAGVSDRIIYLRLSTEAFLRHPILGTGTGSFPSTYAAVAAQRNAAPSSNPHNEYAMMAVQTGIVGLAFLLGFFFVLWRTARVLPIWQRRQAQTLVLAFAVGCLFNSLLLDHKDGHNFAFLVSLFFGGVFLSVPGSAAAFVRAET